MSSTADAASISHDPSGKGKGKLTGREVEVEDGVGKDEGEGSSRATGAGIGAVRENTQNDGKIGYLQVPASPSSRSSSNINRRKREDAFTSPALSSAATGGNLIRKIGLPSPGLEMSGSNYSQVTGPPTPSATRTAFLPSALKKQQQQQQPTSSITATAEDHPSHSDNSKHNFNNRDRSSRSRSRNRTAQWIQSGSSNVRDNDDDNDSEGDSNFSHTQQQQHLQKRRAEQERGQGQDPSQGQSSTNTCHNGSSRDILPFQASSGSSSSAAIVEGGPHSFSPSTMPAGGRQQQQAFASSEMRGNEAGPSSAVVGIDNIHNNARRSSADKAIAGWPLNHSTAGTGLSRRGSSTHQIDEQRPSKGKGSSNQEPSSSSKGRQQDDSSPHQPISYGFASPHMTPDLSSSIGTSYQHHHHQHQPQGSQHNDVNTRERSRSSNNDAILNAIRVKQQQQQQQQKEDEENALAAKLGGGIGPTSSRIKKSTNRAPSSPNNVEGEREHLNSLTGKEKSEKVEKEKVGEINDNDGNNNATATTRKQNQLTFSPKVRKPWSVSWRAIKRKLLLASTGTPSSGDGSRRSETSETSGGSRHRAYLANARERAANNHMTAAAAAAAKNGEKATTGEKTVHIQGIEDEGAFGNEDWEVDQVVVDNEWFDDEGNPLLWGSAHSASAQGGATGTGGGAHAHSHDHHGKSGERVSNSGRDGGTTTAHSETAGSLILNPTIKVIDGVVTLFRGWLIPKLAYFFEPRFGDPEKELNFRKERWYNTKRNATFGCCFMILNWILLVALLNTIGVWQKVLYYGVLTLFVWPVPVMIAFDLPRKWPNFYSFWTITAVMLPAFLGIISMYICHFLRDGSGSCNGQTFLTVQYYATGFAVIALFSLHVNRLATFVSQLVYWILTCVMLLPESPNYSRTAINFLVFSAFILFLHFQQEKIDRRMFTLRTQLKISYRALQKSQIAEKKASNSKKRFISYIFHEVRVPLNTAYLAFQNLQQGGGFNAGDEDQMVEVYALESSLQQVQQVLNDVLDLQRMDAGKFESSSQPFNFHRAINALVASLKVAATAKRLNLEVSLDERIDNLPQSIDIYGQKASYVVGDEIRLRQVLTNIASNAVKFSREGKGGIKLRTRLIWPGVDDPEHDEQHNRISEDEGEGVRGRLDTENDPSEISGATAMTHWKESDITPTHGQPPKSTPYTDSEVTIEGGRTSKDREIDIEKEAGLEKVDEIAHQGHVQGGLVAPSKYLDRHNSDDSDDSSPYSRRKDFIIVRIEIEDNGPGIRPSDMVDQRLFSAYVQTEIGRVQGGKGSGLGLAIVRAIVQMTRGRLGVKSSNKGTTFWIEQRYYFATHSEVQALQELPTPLTFPESIPKPIRPPVKPYKDGESSYSQYSASRMEAANMALQGTPISETDRPFLTAALGRIPAASPGLDRGSMLRNEAHRQSSASSLPSNATGGSAGNLSGVGSSSATNAIDVESPLTSEQWTQNNLERAILPSMNVTAPTPPVPASLERTPTRTAETGNTPVSTSPPVSPREDSSARSQPITSRKVSDGSNSIAQSAVIQATAPPSDSPIGEEAFTPGTRQAVTSPTPDEGIFAESARMSPLTLPGSSKKPGSSTSLPSVSSAPAASSSSSASPQQPVQLNVLVVDDDPLTRKLMSRMMTRLGCNVEEAENGQMFLDIVLGDETTGKAPRYFDLVTLDNAMPVMTGEQAIKVFRKEGRTDLVVGATGNALKSDQTSYLKAGVDTVLTKPISLRDLTAQLNSARKRRNALEEQAAANAKSPLP